jgi:hypothetical protein
MALHELLGSESRLNLGHGLLAFTASKSRSCSRYILWSYLQRDIWDVPHFCMDLLRQAGII